MNSIFDPVAVTVKRGKRTFSYWIEPVDNLEFIRHSKGEMLRASVAAVKSSEAPQTEEELKAFAARITQVGLDQAAAGTEYARAVIMAGVVGHFDPESGAFERIVVVEKDEDRAATPKRVAWRRIQPDAVKLIEAIIALSNGGEDGEAVKALFRDPVGGGEVAHAGDRVPHDTVPGGEVDAG